MTKTWHEIVDNSKSCGKVKSGHGFLGFAGTRVNVSEMSGKYEKIEEDPHLDREEDKILTEKRKEDQLLKEKNWETAITKTKEQKYVKIQSFIKYFLTMT